MKMISSAPPTLGAAVDTRRRCVAAIVARILVPMCVATASADGPKIRGSASVSARVVR
jgi:hypothetical protein